MMSSLSWRRFRSLWFRSLPRGLPPALLTSALARIRVPLCPRSLPAVLAAPFCSISATPRAFPSRALPCHRLTGRHLPAATLAPRVPGARPALLEVPRRPSRALQLLIPPRPSLGRQVRDVVPQAPGNAGGTSIADGCGATPNDRCGTRFWVKLSRVVPCGVAAPTPLLTLTSTTRTMTRCSCLVTRSWRQCFCPLCRRLTISPSRSPALDNFTIIQQDHAEASDHTLLDLGLEDLA